MKYPLFILSAVLIIGCATHPYEGTYRSENGALTLTRAGQLSYREGGVLGEGSYRATGQNCISARVDKQELKLSLIGSERKTEWVSRGPEWWHFVVIPADGTCRRFYGGDEAKRYSEYLSRRAHRA